MDKQIPERRHHGLTIGFLTGTCVGAGLMMWFAPKATAELRRRVSSSMKTFGQRASDQYDDATATVGTAVGDLARTGQHARDEVAGAVAVGAHEVARVAQDVERFAKSAKSSRS